MSTAENCETVNGECSEPHTPATVGISSHIKCTACYRQVNLQKSSAINRHPVLKVIVCKKCYEYYTSGDIKEGEDGIDEQCRWCGDGGKLIGCDYCHNAFCKICIKTNLGRNELASITTGDKWKCYVCDPTPLKHMMAYCTSVMSSVSTCQEKMNDKVTKTTTDGITQNHGGRNKQTPKKKNLVSSDTEDDSSDDETTIFSSQNLKQDVEQLESLVTPLSLLVAEMKEELKKLSKTGGIRAQSKHEALVAKLQHNFVRSYKSLTAFKRSKSSHTSPQPGTAACPPNKPLVSIKRLSTVVNSAYDDDSSKDDTPLADRKVSKLILSKKDLGKCSSAEPDEVEGSADSDAVNTVEPDSQNPKIKSAQKVQSCTRADMNAQRDLHREMLEAAADSSEAENNSIEEESEEESSDSEEVEEEKDDSSDDEYDPKKEVQHVKVERSMEKRLTSKKAKTKTAARKVREIRERIKKNKLKHKHDISDEDNDDDDDDDDNTKKSKKRGNDKKESSRKGSKATVDENKTKEGEDKSQKHKKSTSKKGEGNKSETDEVKNSSDKDESSNEDKEDMSDSDKKSKEKKQRKGKDPQQVEETVDKSSKESLKKKTNKNMNSACSSDKNENSDDSKDGNSDDGKDDDDAPESGKKNKEKKQGKSQDAQKLEKTADKASKKSLKKKTDKNADSECSTDHDESLDKDIESLEKSPILKIRLKDIGGKVEKLPEKSSTGTSSSIPSDKAASTSKAKKSGARRKLLDELSSGEENDAKSNEEDEEEEEEEEEENEKTGPSVPLDVDDDARARKALLEDADEEMEMEDADDLEDADDSDIIDDPVEAKQNAKEKVKKTGKDPAVVAIDHDSADDFEVVVPAKKKKHSKLLSAKLSDSDSDSSKKKKSKDDDDDDVEDSDSGVDKKKRKRKAKKDKKRNRSSSNDEEPSSDDSNSSENKRKRKRRRIKTQSDSSEEKDSKDGSSDDDGSDDDSRKGRKRREIRKIKNKKELSKETVDAAKAEEERRRRIEERQKLFNQVTVEDTSSPIKCQITTQLVLEADSEKTPVIEVHKKLIRKLKPHQVDAVKFMWNCCIESLERLKKDEGSGCILAHCMGLGKTLSVITFVHTILRHPEHLKMKTCLVLCPLNTVLNWQTEFENWLEDSTPLDVYELSSVKDNWGRSELLNDWRKGGGIMIMGYEMFRNLSQLSRIKNKKQKKIFTEALLDPGPDLVVCDEGHVLKNDATGISKATNQVQTKRRIVLTGTPLQNNLVEYHCMVNFVKPNLLGTRKEFCNRFVNPIMNGQCSDSSPYDVKLMKRRAHILHETLAGCVQRKDYTALTKFLLPKHEYVISIRLSKVQIELYEKYLERLSSAAGGDLAGQPLRGSKMFTDYQNLMKIWTHPWVLKMDEVRQKTKRDKMAMNDSEDSFIDDSDEYDSEASSGGKLEKDKSDTPNDDDDDVKVLGSEDEWKPKRRTRRTALLEKKEKEKKRKTDDKDKDDDKSDDSESNKDEVVKGWKTRSRGGEKDANDDEEPVEELDMDKVSDEWWAEYVKSDDQFKLELSGKLLFLYEILQMAESIGDKVLVFSQSLLSLDLIEAFLAHWDESKSDTDTQVAITQGWDKGIDYIRMDGSTSAQNRKEWAEMFNDPENVKARLFLISTKAGSLGINLVAANRVVVFDASWNPTHDVQSIFRVYRFGQTKPVYVYRLLAQGTMEEKIYERQVTKQSLAQRVIDEHQIERHFTANDLRELYIFKPDRLDDPNRPPRPTPKLPKDLLLAELLTKLSEWIVQYHEHDSLLENKIEEELSEEERKAAWEEYDQEKKGLRVPPPAGSGGNMAGMFAGMSASTYPGMAASYVPNYMDAHQIAQAIFRANPGISQQELTEHVTMYLKSQQMQILKQQHEYRLAMERERLKHLHQERLRREAMLNSHTGMVSALLGGRSDSSASAPGGAAPLLLSMMQDAASGKSIGDEPSTSK